jgi:hypothetical protein
VSVVFQIARVGVLSGRREPFLLAIVAVSFDANGGIGGALAKVIRAAASPSTWSNSVATRPIECPLCGERLAYVIRN